MAHKKAAGSAKNLRDSQPKFRGVKIFGGQKATAGSIIIRQKGNKYEAGKNTYLGSDFSIHAEIDGVVRFSKSNKTRFDGRKYLKTVVNVDPVEAKPAKKAPVKKVEKAEVSEVKAEKVETSEEVEKPAKKAPAKKPAAKKTTASSVKAKKATKEE